MKRIKEYIFLLISHFIFDINNNKDKKSLKILSEFFEWMYFILWSLSYYGQIIENFRRHKVNGLSFDYIIFNFANYIVYSIYIIWGYIDHNLGTGKIKIQDIVFVGHTLILSFILILQIIYYYDRNDRKQKINNYTIFILSVLFWGALCIIFVERILKYYNPKITKDKKYIFNFVIYLGLISVFISTIKVIPQIINNFQRKNTIGWNIHFVLINFIGIILYFCQVITDICRSTFSFKPKGQSSFLFIAQYCNRCIYFIYDIIFIGQHYILFKEFNLYLKKDDDYESMNFDGGIALSIDSNITISHSSNL